jgi:hypothetical protein
MISIYWHENSKKWLSVKTGGIVDPVKAGMLVDVDLSDKYWEIELRKLGFRFLHVPYSELKKVTK